MCERVVLLETVDVARREDESVAEWRLRRRKGYAAALKTYTIHDR